MEGKAVLEELLEGNRRYVDGEMVYPHQQRGDRLALKNGQSPKAIILGCSDSRVPPEIIFDQGLGDLFVIRVAGNVIDDIVLGSIEYAAEHLGSSLLMVMGHSNCGAVQAAMDDTALDGHVPKIAEVIEEAVRASEADDLDSVVKVHAKITAGHLGVSQPVIGPLANSGELLVVAAFYDFDTGLVEVLQ